ncbi:16S rRNA (cytosine(967)-C(5))-methyltransferase RsmB [Christensenellaceae bacterium OttesenSCG-928-L17]|nr:16S rRNA (cytosine(967)-C(5))-methyltransferase RsmB [Christensenellaceae bacterium OttesenSCG-928-L17]
MSTRRLALHALMDITERGAYANLRLKEAQAGLNERDAKWLSALVYETLDHLYYIDYVIETYARGSLRPVVRAILRLGVCQLLFLRTPAPAACSESVKLTKEVGKAPLAGYVNGVLREIARNIDNPVKLPETEKERLSVQYSWPLFLIEEWIARFGAADTERLIAYRQKGFALRAQPPFTAEELEAALQQKGIPCARGKWEENCVYAEAGFDIANDPLYQAGKMTAQSEAAMLACRAVGIQPNMRVLDACAAPGGKTAYLFACANGEAELHAWELHPHRKELLEKTLARLHVTAAVRLQDAACYVEEFKNHFDAVLLDVPCSGLGVAGGKPDIRYRKTKADVYALAVVQQQILETAAHYVRPGGVLVYTSCTISHTENEEQIVAFLRDNEAFVMESLEGYLPEGLMEDTTGMLQLLPHVHQTDGFFIARMRKSE